MKRWVIEQYIAAVRRITGVPDRGAIAAQVYARRLTGKSIMESVKSVAMRNSLTVPQVCALAGKEAAPGVYAFDDGSQMQIGSDASSALRATAVSLR